MNALQSNSELEPLPERGPGGRFLPRAESPPRSPQRQGLAEAIERFGALDRQLGRLAEARERLGLRDKERAQATARQGIAEARQRAPEAEVARSSRVGYTNLFNDLVCTSSGENRP
jgi:hypothetical protein